jgi:hypothetical protein
MGHATTAITPTRVSTRRSRDNREHIIEDSLLLIMGSNTGDILSSSDVLAQLNSAESESLLDVIDRLQDGGLERHLNLPQIIVVGDQSSGKSSVLEAITRVRLPVAGDDICTRFAIALAVRRSPEERVQVKIRWVDEVGKDRFHRSGSNRGLLVEFMREAKELIDQHRERGMQVSMDVLHVEISGPELYPLTLVDLPGIFHSAALTQSAKDKELVYELIGKYMKMPESIILQVVSANANLPKHHVLEEARKYDPDRKRTLGVITMPDIAGPNEDAYIELINDAKGQDKLPLGWFVLRNPSHTERDMDFKVRDKHERLFFQAGKWSNVRKQNCGVESLRNKLRELLLERIKSCLPELMKNMSQLLLDLETKKTQLGNARSSPGDLRSYLHDIAEQFQRISRNAVDAVFADKFFDGEYGRDRKLRAMLRKLSRAFELTMLERGGTYDILSPVYETEDFDDEANDDKSKSDSGKDSNLDSNEDSTTRRAQDVPGYLTDFVDKYQGVNKPKSITLTALDGIIEDMAAENLGKEFPGTPNPQLALRLFQIQSKPWEKIAWFYVEQILSFTQSFVEQLFQHIIGSNRESLNAILAIYVDTFFDERRTILQQKLEELLFPYTSGYGFPLASEFHQRLSKATQRRLADQVTEFLLKEFPELFIERFKKPLSQSKLQRAIVNADDFETSEFRTETVVDMMTTYYEVT